ncbi:zinc ribbon domain-containing protein [Methanobrevibacter sp.]|uniref:zinc ribbon domain-containing protein n=1 Tax=Methanobrevibacter sp. TaxID=66852 RepID=UPI00388DB17C
MTKFCPECGAQQRDDNVKFCSNCGFDFSKIENKDDSQGIGPETIKIDISGSDDSNLIKSSSSNVQNAKTNDSNKSSPKVSTARTSDSKKSSSSGQINKKSSSNGLLSYLSFNKCFFAFAALLILLTIFGMTLQVTETEPSSDYGLTSFMESSGGYSIDNSYYYDDSDSNSNYLSYGILSVEKMTDFV